VSGRLFLLRHAKAAWPGPGTQDFDRPLTADGIREAEAMAGLMAAAGHVPKSVLCSPARRCRETWAAMADAFDPCPVEYLDELYRADPAGYLETVRLYGNGDGLLVVGHNPMTEELAMALTTERWGSAPAPLAGGFPTCGLAVISLTTPLAELRPGKGRLEAFLTPRALAG
jgi:phosphohistidine phosphatase